MNITLIEYPPCSTCKKARDFLSSKNVSFNSRNIKENPPTKEEIKYWMEKYSIDLKKFWNTSGILYKEYNLKEKLLSMSEEEKLELMTSNGMLIKRPILCTEKGILIGFKEANWLEALK